MHYLLFFLKRCCDAALSVCLYHHTQQQYTVDPRRHTHTASSIAAASKVGEEPQRLCTCYCRNAAVKRVDVVIVVVTTYTGVLRVPFSSLQVVHGCFDHHSYIDQLSQSTGGQYNCGPTVVKIFFLGDEQAFGKSHGKFRFCKRLCKKF